MVREEQRQPDVVTRRGLVVGNYCHDILIRDGLVVGESLGGAASFISNVLDGLLIPCDYVCKVGSDFAYSVTHPPMTSPSSMTTLFHAHFFSNRDESRHQDRVLRRIHACGPISPSDLPESQFDFGLAVGVAGEILPETLERMLDICRTVFVDIQALIRVFDPADGTVKLVGLKESGFFHLLPRIGFLKASAEEAPYVDIEEARKWCSVVVTEGKDGCRIYSKDEKMQILPFPAVQIDPTGAGDSFLGGLVVGLVRGLSVPDAALLGNFFGSLTVGQIGLPKFDSRLLQRVNDELQRKIQCISCCETRNAGADFRMSVEHKDFQASLIGATKSLTTYCGQEDQWSSQSSPEVKEQSVHHQNNGHQKLLFQDPVYEETAQHIKADNDISAAPFV
ncbi:PREDICTED: inositol 3-kinase-like isoform X1 [Nelumbo nucifera]|uniref:Inositol 3-kinase-like isoform X1 n=1 Tax=Nelumbo nucifera TaxID=4432 RepID=A0A1U7ZXK4_NELNU|nr:PREDICTED: inositol 3-kinase-like isoform X1 [Nelumbo nucifera]